MGQWIACTSYASVSNIVAAGTNAVYPLMTMPDYTTIDPSALEDETIVGDFMIHRIVGQVTMIARPENDTGDYLWGWRVMMLPIDLSTGQIQVPWAPTDSPLRSVDISNEPRWLAERWRWDVGMTTGFVSGLDSVSIPWWTQLDIEPKVHGGPHVGNEYPVLVFDNVPNTDGFIAYHRLRMYVELDGRR